ncbi:MAG: transglutaminase-like cysteine peptidase [Stellaceae bacterium]
MIAKYCRAATLFRAIFCLLALSTATETAAAAAMATGAPAIPPAGFIGFCAKYLQECTGSSGAADVVQLSAARQRELDGVQAEINRSIRPREDPAHVWDYPVDGTGDCNKFALAKRRALIALGWPRDALLLTAALTEQGEGHLVLVARTSAGDLVLDNRLAPVVDWTRLPYRWLSRQSERRPTEWLSILPTTIADAR